MILSNACLRATSFDKSQRHSNTLSHQLSRIFSSASFAIILHTYSKIVKTLYLTCQSTALDELDSIKRCLRFSNTNSCKFSCPRNCNNNSQFTHNVWQQQGSGPFSYLSRSSICQSAYHSNILNSLNNFKPPTGFLVWKRKISPNTSYTIVNNGITSNIWPMKFVNNKEEIFSFKGNPHLTTPLKSGSNNNITVLVKALFSINDIDNITATVYESSTLDLRLKRIIPGSEVPYTITALSKHIASLTWDKSNLTIKSVNSYYDLDSVKFPVNIGNNLHMINQHTYQSRRNGSFHLNPDTNKTSLKKFRNCNWYYNGFNTGQSCKIALDLSFTPYENITDIQNFVTILNTNLKLSEFNLFTRVQYQTNQINSTCPKNRFGTKCQFTCPNLNCSGYLLCQKDPIGCSCLPGFTGFACNITCDKTNQWGPNCQNQCPPECPNTCDIYSGLCSPDSDMIQATKTATIAANEAYNCQMNFSKKCFQYSAINVRLFSIRNETEIICYSNICEVFNKTSEALEKFLSECSDFDPTWQSTEETCRWLLKRQFKLANFIGEFNVHNTQEAHLTIETLELIDNDMWKIEFYILDGQEFLLPIQILESNFLGVQEYEPILNQSDIRIRVNRLNGTFKSLTNYKVYVIFKFPIEDGQLVHIGYFLGELKSQCSLGKWGDSCEMHCRNCSKCSIINGRCLGKKI